MTRQLRNAAVAGGIALALAVACVTPQAAREAGLPARADEDTLRGILTIVGAEPATTLLLAGSLDSARLRDTVPGLRAAAGLDVVVVGRRTGPTCSAPAPECGRATMVVRAFRVRSAAGVPAIDGVVEPVGDTYRLRLADGSAVTVPMLPPLLRAAVGARVYLAGPLDRAPDSYGILVPRP